MQNKINLIKKKVKQECFDLKNVQAWFYDGHLMEVEKAAKRLLLKLPKANKDIVMLSVWLHDLQRVRGIKGDHQKVGATEAEKVLKEFSYDDESIMLVKEAILTHSCSNKMPKTLEAKILATADAMSHYYSNFYLEIALTGKRNLKEYKQWTKEKLNRDYNEKIFFPFAKKEIKKKHELLMKFFDIK